MTADNRAIQPVSGPALWSYADECLEALQAHLRANNEEQNAIAEMEAIISGYERQYGMSTFTFLRRLMADEIEDCFDFNVWGMIASELGYDAPLRPVPQPVSLTTVAVLESAPAANVGANSGNTVNPADRGDIGGGGNAVNVAADTDLETVADDAGKSDVVKVSDAPIVSLPEAGGRGDGKADYPRFHPMKGFSKVQRKIWHWLDEHAAEVNHKYPTQRDVAEAVGTTHPTAGKYLKQWRMHNNITTPDFYQDQAS